MRRMLAVLVLVAACTGGHGKSLPTPAPTSGSLDECERESKNAHIVTTVLDAKNGEKRSEQPAPHNPRKDGLFSQFEPQLPPLQAPVTDDHPGAYGNRLTVHPPGAPAWTASGRIRTEVNGIAIVENHGPLGLHAVKVSNG